MRVKLFTHTDLDGIGCAVLAYLAFGKENVDVEYCNYDDVDDKVEEFMEDDSLYRSYDNIFITDISVSDSVANMIDILDRVDRRVQLFDHHGTALFLNKYDWCNVTDLSPLHDCKTSGTELFYVELMNHGYFSVNNDIKYRINVDKFVMNVRDYDTWRWKELGEFGIVCKQLNDLFYIYGRDEFVEWTIKRINMFVEPSPMFTFPYFDQTDVALLNQKHQDIDIYVEEKKQANKEVYRSVG